ncbi:uncharacterized protein IWZ02DRAFT_447501 [Phyllosticta citriasiana]|uniref:uncharacterized protein n=1 Tax=Phyllosticta citriasiana TaxID=595635 RepID=UPI0030FDDA9C
MWSKNIPTWFIDNSTAAEPRALPPCGYITCIVQPRRHFADLKGDIGSRLQVEASRLIKLTKVTRELPASTKPFCLFLFFFAFGFLDSRVPLPGISDGPSQPCIDDKRPLGPQKSPTGIAADQDQTMPHASKLRRIRATNTGPLVSVTTCSAWPSQ